jgi:hypothetical protein
MAHRLLVPPVRRFEGRARLPLIQHPGERVAQNLTATLQDRDSLRRSGTSRAGIMLGPLAPLQRFVLTGVGYPNSPENLAQGVQLANAPRLAASTRGQSAGI